MLHPNQFKVNDAWIAFRLNDAAIETESDGDFTCMALMDAASCFILGMEMYPSHVKELSAQEARRLLQQGKSHKGQMPRKLFVAEEQASSALALEATRSKVEVVIVAEGELLVFISEARDGFKERFGRTQ